MNRYPTRQGGASLIGWPFLYFQEEGQRERGGVCAYDVGRGFSDRMGSDRVVDDIGLSVVGTFDQAGTRTQARGGA
jgi:hypothetical protein